jgi:hypothetical protein
MARPRFFTGILVASTNTLRSIKARRLEVEVHFNSSHRVISEKVLDIRRENFPVVSTKKSLFTT